MVCEWGFLPRIEWFEVVYPCVRLYGTYYHPYPLHQIYLVSANRIFNTMEVPRWWFRWCATELQPFGPVCLRVCVCVSTCGLVGWCVRLCECVHILLSEYECKCVGLCVWVSVWVALCVWVCVRVSVKPCVSVWVWVVGATLPEEIRPVYKILRAVSEPGTRNNLSVKKAISCLFDSSIPT